MLQSCPGCPCAGLSFAVVPVPGNGLDGCVAAGCAGNGLFTGVVFEAGKVVFVLAGELSGCPTAISQRWPGCPCAGFNFPDEALVLFAPGKVMGVGFTCVLIGLLVTGFEAVAVLFNGAPTAIEQSCPGCPCAGFNFAPALLPMVGCGGKTESGISEIGLLVSGL